MPQMAPLNWLMLLFTFLIVFMTFNIMNFYIFNYQNKIKTMIKKTKLINWKW